MKPYDIYRSIKPYILGLISLSGGGTGPYAPSPHDLSSAHHSGSLVSSQYPDALLTDGSRSLLGNLTVGSGITVDGVDISAHVANANAHHAQQHTLVGSDHTASGLTIGHVLRASGATTFVFAQLQHTDLGGVLANQHHNQVHGIVSSDHTVTGSALDVIGLSAANTLGVLTPSSDVGTTPAAAILKSTASGGLILGALTVKGAVDITQDLTVGANVLFVDVSGNNVGIAGAPDPQFALDVNGPFHADAIYGPLGRLLKDCIFLAHYDGPLFPYNYGGSPQTVQGEIPATNTGGVIYRPAKYNKGVQTGYATVNKMTNSVFGNATWNWGWTAGTDISVFLNTNPTVVYAGYNSAVAIRNTAGESRVFYQSIDVGNTNTHCLSAYVKKLDGSAVTASDLDLYYNVPLTTTYTNLEDGWYLLSAIVTGIASAQPTGVRIVALSTYYFIGGVQIEEKGYPTPLAHGSMGQGHSWGGTEYASTTTRSVTFLRYIHTIPLNDFSIGFWVQPWLAQSENTAQNWAMCWGYDANNYIGLVYTTTGFYLQIAIAGVVTTTSALTGITRGSKYHVAIVQDGTTLVFYVDGEIIDSISASISSMAGMPSLLAIGSYYTGANPITGLIDDFYVVKRAQSQDDIRAIIDSDVPVASEFGSTSWYSGGLAPIWVDGEGFWMRDLTGNPVFGWSAVNSKSWGGVTLDAGDNLIGQYGASEGGWQQWDRSAGELALGYSDVKAIRFYAGNAEITGKLQMPGTASAIAIGATPPTGAAVGTGIWIDRTGFYGLLSGAYQVKIDAATGALLAGADAVRIDVGGIQINANGDTNNSTIRFLGASNRYTGGIVYGTQDSFSGSITIKGIGVPAGSGTGTATISAYSGGGTPSLIVKSTEVAQYIAVMTAGLSVGREADVAAGDIVYTGALKSYKNSTEYTGYVFVPLAAPLTSANYTIDSFSTSAKTLIDLSAEFGAPAGIKAVLFSYAVRDSASLGTDNILILSPNNTSDLGISVSAHGQANNTWSRGAIVVPCDANGDVYRQIAASGSLTFDILLEIWGYWI